MFFLKSEKKRKIRILDDWAGVKTEKLGGVAGGEGECGDDVAGWLVRERRSLDILQVYTTLQSDNHASTPPLRFFTGRMPFLPPNQQHKALKASKALKAIFIHSVEFNKLCNLVRTTGASTPYKRWSKCTMKKIGGGRFLQELRGEVRKLFMHFPPKFLQ